MSAFSRLFRGAIPLRAFLSALVLALMLPLTTLVATPASAVNSSVSGVVEDTAGGVEDIEVWIYGEDPVDGNYYLYDLTYTEPNGSYVFGAVPEGNYKVGAPNEGALYLPSFYNGETTLEDALVIDVGPTAVTGIDLALSPVPQGVVSGSVVSDDAPTVGLDQVLVTPWKLYSDGVSWDPLGAFATETNAQGEYSIALPVGTYHLGFEDLTSTFQSEFYDNTRAVEGADDVEVIEGDVTTVDASLGVTGWISGNVSDEDTLDPIADADVTLYALVGADWEAVDWAQTDIDGNYLLTGGQGTYRVGFDGSVVGFGAEYFDDEAELAVGDPVEITGPGEETAGIDALLSSSGQVKGVVTAVGTGPVSGIEVLAYRNFGTAESPAWEWDGTSVFTNAEGEYTLPVSGTLRVGFDDLTDTFASEFYDDQPFVNDADDVTVLGGDVVTGIDAELSLPGHITGTVTDGTGAGLTGVYVDAYRNVGTASEPNWQSIEFVETGAGGTYDLPVSPGRYRVGFYSDADGTEAFYKDRPTLRSAVSVVVTGSETLTDIDGVLAEPDLGGGPELDLTVDPVITGAPRVGVPLQVSKGTWQPTPTTFTYVWYVDGNVIAGASSPQYVPTSADIGRLISASVTPQLAGYEPAIGYAEEVGPILDAPVNVTLPTVTGTPVVGATMTATPGTWLPASPPVTYQWLANGGVIAGATAKTFKPTTAQIGKKLSVRVTATKPGAESATATSAATATVKTKPTMTLKSKVKGTTVTLTIRLTATGVSPVTGRVKVYRKSKLLKTVTLSSGKAKVKLKKQPKGKTKYKASYLGSTTVLAIKKSLKVAV